MKTVWTAVLSGVFVVSVLACQPAEEAPAAPEEPMEVAETEPAAEPEMGPDAVEVDPDHYAVELENDAVRVLRITYGPGETSSMHYHPDSLAFFVIDQSGTFEMPDGTTQSFEMAAGDVLWADAGQHLPSSSDEGSIHVIQVELMDGAAMADDGEMETGPDAVEVDPDHYAVEFENDAVRVLRITYGPGETSSMHYHPDAVAIFVTDHKVSFELPDGTSEEVEAEAGDVIWTPAGQHLPTNLSEDAELEVVLVELKG